MIHADFFKCINPYVINPLYQVQKEEQENIHAHDCQDDCQDYKA